MATLPTHCSIAPDNPTPARKRKLLKLEIWTMLLQHPAVHVSLKQDAFQMLTKISTASKLTESVVCLTGKAMQLGMQ